MSSGKIEQTEENPILVNNEFQINDNDIEDVIEAVEEAAEDRSSENNKKKNKK